MSSEYRCPHCGDVIMMIDLGSKVECPQCGKSWNKKAMSGKRIDTENILSEQELEGFYEAFKDEPVFKDEKKLKELLDSIEKDLQ